MAMSNELRAEIETIMTEHQGTLFAKVLVGMSNGLSNEEMSAQADSARQPIRADGIAAVRRIVAMCLNDDLVTAPSEAEEQANFYRELLNHQPSPELAQHITTRLTMLAAIGPNVRFTPLGEGTLGNPGPGLVDKPEPPRCPKCGLHHTGECF